MVSELRAIVKFSYYYACNMSEPKIREFFANVGILLSDGELSNWLTLAPALRSGASAGVKDWPELHAEKDTLYAAGLRSSPWRRLDDTAPRVNGDNQYCHVVCNPLYTAFFTTPHKDRLTILDILRNLQARAFRVNPEAIAFLHVLGLSQRLVRTVQSLAQDQDLSEAEFNQPLDERLPRLGSQQRTHILEATAVAAYHAQLEFPVVQLLICDDAPQFNWVTEQLALCWIHEGRHYKKREPSIPQFRRALDQFTQQFWQDYDQLLA